MFTAGEYKRTVTVFGENTDEDRAKYQEEINRIHELFKAFVKNIVQALMSIRSLQVNFGSAKMHLRLTLWMKWVLLMPMSLIL